MFLGCILVLHLIFYNTTDFEHYVTYYSRATGKNMARLHVFKN